MSDFALLRGNGTDDKWSKAGKEFDLQKQGVAWFSPHHAIYISPILKYILRALEDVVNTQKP